MERGVAAGDRHQRGGLALGVVVGVEVEAAVAAEDVVHLHEAAGVARPQAEDDLGGRVVDGLDGDHLSCGDGGVLRRRQTGAVVSTAVAAWAACSGVSVTAAAGPSMPY